MRKKERAAAAVKLLSELYPNAVCSLEYQDAFQLLIATRLSAQCTDKRVNMVTPALFKEFPTAKSMANADIARVEELIKTCGLYKTKAKDLVGIAKQITERFGGRVPDTKNRKLGLRRHLRQARGCNRYSFYTNLRKTGAYRHNQPA
mgnify:CR=1 FL=1